MENAAALSIELNSENNDGLTAFHLACHFVGQVKGHSDVIKILVENAAALSINLTTFLPEQHDTTEIINKLLLDYE
jgi:ankyrin repeat protein